MSKDSYNKSGLIFFLSSLGISLVWVSYFTLIHNHIDLSEFQEEEKKDATEKLGELWKSSEIFIEKGAKVYKMHCAVCHGAEGLGDGTPSQPPPRNLVEGKWKQGGKSKDLFLTIQKGISGTTMASFQYLKIEDRWALVHYIRSITKNKTPETEEELKAFAEEAE